MTLVMRPNRPTLTCPQFVLKERHRSEGVAQFDPVAVAQAVAVDGGGAGGGEVDAGSDERSPQAVPPEAQKAYPTLNPNR